MAGPIKKLRVIAAADGIILRSIGQRNQQSIQISYATHEISHVEPSKSAESYASVEAYGILSDRQGLLRVTPVSYLILIAHREEVAQIRGIPVFVVSRVTLIPLSSQSEASQQIRLANGTSSSRAARKSPGATNSDTSDNEENHTNGAAERGRGMPAAGSNALEDDVSEEDKAATAQGQSDVARDVIGRKGLYGRFAERWFSRNGWSAENRRAQGMSTDDALKLPSATSRKGDAQNPKSNCMSIGRTSEDAGPLATNKKSDPSTHAQDHAERKVSVPTSSVGNALLPKFLRTTRILLESQSFFFSYDCDITSRIGFQEKVSSEVPLHKLSDPTFFWNHHLLLPLIEGGHSAFVLPLMQGFVGQRAFSVDRDKYGTSNSSVSINEDNKNTSTVADQAGTEVGDKSSNFLVTLISRRSVQRPGLRYLRRGIDENGNCANTVETEQILSKASWAFSEKIYSYTQIRASIPLFFSQSPYSFKPVPVLQHSHETNRKAFSLHFSKLRERYHKVQIALLVDKIGGEAAIGQAFEDFTAQNNAHSGSKEQEIKFEWFDFHKACSRMRFENVALLMDSLGQQLDEFGETVEIEGKLERKQAGVLRTNCMDCLDRTNVVQSSCGQRFLEKQLKEEGFSVDLLKDISTQWFNTLWADNGDQISRQYSSTAALKGDYTRTRERNYRGAITDLGLTLSRFYNNNVNDYFSQTVIDYVLGNASAEAFDDFEATLESRDPAISIAKIRANAIETSSKITIAYLSEDLINGWTFLSPSETNTVRRVPCEECILLLTDAALYRVKYDWDVEQVQSYDRVELTSLKGILKGTYITSILSPSQRDPERNVGFVLKYTSGTEITARVNTRSLSSAVGLNGTDASETHGALAQADTKEDPSMLNVLAFKALPADSRFTSDKEGQETTLMSEKETVDTACEEIKRAALGDRGGPMNFIEDQDIVSVEEARKGTGLIEQWGHSLKKMVWA